MCFFAVKTAETSYEGWGSERCGEIREKRGGRVKYASEGISLQNRREVNMDCLLLKTKVLHERPLQFAVVCDGVGSMNDGEYASRKSVQMLCTWMDSLETDIGLGIQLCGAVKKINRYIIDQAEKNQLRTASTLSALLLYKRTYYIAHVGDSRIYLLQERSLRQLTPDQTRNGKLANYMGKPCGFEVYYGEGRILSANFLLCSDGFYKRIENDELSEWMSKITRKNQRYQLEDMAQLVIARGESDNISAGSILCEE